MAFRRLLRSFILILIAAAVGIVICRLIGCSGQVGGPTPASASRGERESIPLASKVECLEACAAASARINEFLSANGFKRSILILGRVPKVGGNWALARPIPTARS
jgi:hypothetical protein